MGHGAWDDVFSCCFVSFDSMEDKDKPCKGINSMSRVRIDTRMVMFLIIFKISFRKIKSFCNLEDNSNDRKLFFFYQKYIQFSGVKRSEKKSCCVIFDATPHLDRHRGHFSAEKITNRMCQGF